MLQEAKQKNGSSSTFTPIILFLLSIIVSSGSAYLNYNGILQIDKSTAGEIDRDYQAFLEEKKYLKQLEEMADYETVILHTDTLGNNQTGSYENSEIAKPEKSAYEKICESESFCLINPIIYTYTGIENQECYSEKEHINASYSISSGEQITAVGFDESDIVLQINSEVYVYAPKDKFAEGANYATLDGAVDLRGYLPHAYFSLDFSTSQNITGRSLYPGIPIMESYTAERLYLAAERFWEDGYTIIIKDAYRPITAQYALWEEIGDKTFIVNPYEYPSWHNVGRAVDISLIENKSQTEVELPSPVYDFSPHSFRNNEMDWSDEAVKNVNYITSVMKWAGFETVDSMWWHYELRDKDVATTEEILNYNSLKYEPLS